MSISPERMKQLEEEAEKKFSLAGYTSYSNYPDNSHCHFARVAALREGYLAAAVSREEALEYIEKHLELAKDRGEKEMHGLMYANVVMALRKAKEVRK